MATLLTERIQAQTDAYNAVATVVAESGNPVDNRKRNNTAVRAWRFNIRQNIARLEKADATNEDQITQLNTRIDAVNADKDELMPVEIYTKAQAEDYIGQLEKHKRDLLKVRNAINEITAKNRTMVAQSLNERATQVDKNIQMTQEWLDNQKTSANGDLSQDTSALEDLKAEIARLNSEV